MRRCTLLFATLLLLFSQWAAADYRIGVSIARVDDNFMTYVRNGLDEAAKKENVQIQFEDAQGDVVRQLNQVQGFINQQVDAVIVLPVDTSATANITRAAVEAKTPLVYVNRHPDERTLPKGVVTVASNDIEAGQLQMRYLAEKLGGKGNLAIIMGDLAQNATHDRTEGVKQVLRDYPGIKIVEQQSAEWQRNKGMDLTSNYGYWRAVVSMPSSPTTTRWPSVRPWPCNRPAKPRARSRLSASTACLTAWQRSSVGCWSPRCSRTPRPRRPARYRQHSR